MSATPAVQFHSDDLGMTPSVTRGIADAWSQGLLHGFSVLGNGPALALAGDLLAAQQQRPAYISAHLNLTEGQALHRGPDAALLTNDEGRLNRSVGGLLRWWTFASRTSKARLLEQVRQEWRAQIAAVRSVLGERQINAVDGHVHVHMLPFLFPVAADLAVEFDIPRIRISREPFHLSRRWRDSLAPGFAVNLVKHALCRAWAPGAERHAGARGLESPDRFLGLLYSGRMTAPAARAGINAASRAGAHEVEVLFHVGRADPGEAGYWSDNPGAGRFPLDIGRDRERAELQILQQDPEHGTNDPGPG